MGIFSIFNRQKSDRKQVEEDKDTYKFNEDDREHSLAIRRQKAEIRKLELERQRLEAQARIDELKEELYGSQEDEPKEENLDSMLMTILLPLVMKNNNQTQNLNGAVVPNSSNPPQTSTAPNNPIMSDDEIRKFLDSQDKKHLKLAKTLPKGILFRQVNQQIPISETEFEHAYKILQEEY